MSSAACSTDSRESRSTDGTIAMRRWSSIHLDTRRLSSGTSFPGSVRRWRRRAEIVRRKVDDDRLPRMWLLREISMGGRQQHGWVGLTRWGSGTCDSCWFWGRRR